MDVDEKLVKNLIESNILLLEYLGMFLEDEGRSGSADDLFVKAKELRRIRNNLGWTKPL